MYTYNLTRLLFNNGMMVQPRKLTVIIGPNNSGKSRILKEIVQKTTQRSTEAGIIVTDVDWSLPNSLEELSEGYSDIERYKESNGRQSFRVLAPELNQENSMSGGNNYPDWHKQNFQALLSDKKLFAHEFGKALIAFLTTEHRLLLVKESPSAGDERQAANLLQILHKDSSLDKPIQALVKRAFNIEVLLDTITAPAKSVLRVTDKPLIDTQDRNQLRKFMGQLGKLDDQGDGLRSFVAIVVALFTVKRDVFLIDEPEAFLHPPQAFRIGEFIAEQAKTSRQIIVATHSVDVLRGILSKINANSSNKNETVLNADEIIIIRVDRREKINYFHQLNLNNLQDLVYNPLLSSARVIDGLFYSSVIVVEADSDSRFYHAASSKYRNDIDFHFVNADNKQTVPRIREIYRRMGVRCVGIVDFDVLNNHSEFKKQLESLEISQIRFDNLLRIRQEIANAAKEVPPDERLATIKQELEALLNSIKEMTDKTFEMESEVSSQKEKLLKKIEVQCGEIIDSTKNWQEFKKNGCKSLPSHLQYKFVRLWVVCARRGLFINPYGELESLLAEYDIPWTKKKRSWIRKALEQLPNLEVSDELSPWKFVKLIQAYLTKTKNVII
jgi:predicted ATPase